jgi:hypothetical protein
MTEEHKLQKLVNNLKRRDEESYNSINRYSAWDGVLSIEQRLALTEGRAMDALMAITILSKYIIEKEDERLRRNPTEG